VNSGTEATQRALLLKEIACIVGDAERNSDVLATGTHAAMLYAAYPDAHLSLGRIIDEIVLAASTKKVAVEINRPHPETC
jgi:hypothetical protein